LELLTPFLTLWRVASIIFLVPETELALLAAQIHDFISRHGKPEPHSPALAADPDVRQ
jgi:hypothetical protein